MSALRRALYKVDAGLRLRRPAPVIFEAQRRVAADLAQLVISARIRNRFFSNSSLLPASILSLSFSTWAS